MKIFPRFLIAALFFVCSATVVIAGAESSPPATETTQPIPWSEVGAKAGAQYQGDGLDVTAISQDEASLRCVFQKLEGKATRDGLWLTSTDEAGQTERFRVKARAVGRMDKPPVLLANDGKVVTSGSTVSLSRPGLIEEYSSSMDGLRQDFVVLQRPEGVGALSVELDITGAAASAMSGGAELRLPVSGRKIAYTRLRVTDAQGQALSAHMEVSESTKLKVVVEDSKAMYPVRIDPTFSDADWMSMGVSPAFSATPINVYAMSVVGSDLYLGGQFTSAGNVPCNNIVKWNGLYWSNLGAGSVNGVNGPVSALVTDGSNLYVGGEFTTAGGTVLASKVAKWDGTSWSALGSGIGPYAGDEVRTMAVMGGSLYVGGRFNAVFGGTTVSAIARWNGSAWSALGTGLNSIYEVNSLLVSGSNLYVGGRFDKTVATQPTPIVARNIARWDGAAWTALGGSVPNTVLTLASWGTHLYAGCRFNLAGSGSDAQSLVRWDGAVWTAIGSALGYSGSASGEVRALTVFQDELYVGGNFNTVGGSEAHAVVKWTGSAWGLLPLSTDPNPHFNTTAFAIFGSKLCIANTGLRQWNGTQLSTFGAGLNNPVNALAISGTDLYAGGTITLAGDLEENQEVSNIAKWNGSEWAGLGEGVNGFVNALVISGGDLYVGGEFTQAGGQAANYIARWNGSAWSPVGGGVSSSVLALTASNGSIYAGGNFITAGGVTVNRIAKWNGSVWSAFGSGADNRVATILVAGANLYAGGFFTKAGGVTVNRVAKWNGSAWSALGSGMNDTVYSLAMSNGQLYAGGKFVTAGGSPASMIALWNGSTWSPLGSGLADGKVVPAVRTVLAVGTDVYVGGDFTTAGGNPASRIARWDGTGWSAIGAGLTPFHPESNTLAYAHALVRAGSDIYVGGYFSAVGDKTSTSVAKLTNVPLPLAPDIAVEQPTDNELFDGDTKDFGSARIATSVSLSFTLRNVGTSNLTGLTMTKDGVHAAMFTITEEPSAPVTSLNSTTFTIQFTPTSAGLKTAAIHIASNDPDENPFDLILTGTGITPPPAVPPFVKTLPATAITHNSAILNGTVNAKGSARAVAFDYGLTTAYGASVTAIPASVDGSTDTSVSAAITGLLPHTKYNFRVHAAGPLGAAIGANMTFTTLNRAPVATGETVLALPSAKVTIPVLSNDADPDGDALSITTISPLAASVGTVAKVGTDLVFTPSATFNGGSFTYMASDALGLKSNAATVTLQLAACTLGPDVTIPADSPPYDLTVSATAPWTVIESLPWLSFVPPAPGATSVRFIPAPNPSKDSRTGAVKIGGKTHTVTQSGVLVAPVLTTPAPIPNAAVSANYDLIIPTLNGPVTYTTTGMPKGLSLSNVTGRITGYPTEAKTSTVTVKAKNVWNDSNTISFDITVVPFPPALVGSYSAAIADSETLTDKLGGLMTMSVTNTGGVTGALKLGAGSHSFTGRLNTAANLLAPDPDHAVLKTSVKRTGKSAVDLTVNMNSTDTNLITGDVTLPGAVPAIAALSGSKHVWQAITKPADAFKGYFTAALEPTDPSASIPQGDGFLTFSVSAAGAVSWSGQLADGTVIATQSTTLGANGDMPLFALLYGGKGSLSQRLSIASGTKVVSGSPHWHKKPQTTRAYAAGFDPTTLTAAGAEYLPPGAGQTLLNIAAPGSANIDFSGGGVNSVSQFSDLDQVFNVSATHAATFAGVNPALVKLTKLDVIKGTFTGSLTLKDNNPYNAALPQVARPVTFNGVLLPASGKGTGYFLLPGITGPPANMTTSPMTSGRVRIVP